MGRAENEQHQFTGSRERAISLAGRFVDDPEVVVDQATEIYDAMDLVPYMCATDDLMSDAGGQGLRRTGTIALGAHQCDFRYKSGGEPLRLVEQYPERIHDSGR